MHVDQLRRANYAARNITHFAHGFAWPARDDRSGRFVVAVDHEPFFRLAVHDDHGELRLVPSADVLGGTALPLAYFPEGQH